MEYNNINVPVGDCGAAELLAAVEEALPKGSPPKSASKSMVVDFGTFGAAGVLDSRSNVADLGTACDLGGLEENMATPCGCDSGLTDTGWPVGRETLLSGMGRGLVTLFYTQETNRLQVYCPIQNFHVQSSTNTNLAILYRKSS